MMFFRMCARVQLKYVPLSIATAPTQQQQQQQQQQIPMQQIDVGIVERSLVAGRAIIVIRRSASR